MNKKMHFRDVKRLTRFFHGELSITIPCGANIILTKGSTKNKDEVTCKRCLKFISNIQTQ